MLVVCQWGQGYDERVGGVGEQFSVYQYLHSYASQHYIYIYIYIYVCVCVGVCVCVRMCARRCFSLCVCVCVCARACVSAVCTNLESPPIFCITCLRMRTPVDARSSVVFIDVLFFVGGSTLVNAQSFYYARGRFCARRAFRIHLHPLRGKVRARKCTSFLCQDARAPYRVRVSIPNTPTYVTYGIQLSILVSQHS